MPPEQRVGQLIARCACQRHQPRSPELALNKISGPFLPRHPGLAPLEAVAGQHMHKAAQFGRYNLLGIGNGDIIALCQKAQRQQHQPEKE